MESYCRYGIDDAVGRKGTFFYLRDIVVKQNEGGFEWKSVENIRDSTVSGTCRLEP
jgi:hypothetical protein